jgi:DNA invertase Pin-like site-specific DNA recombinase
MQDFSLPPPTDTKRKRSPYKLPERMRTMQDIYSLILEGYPYNKVMQQLQISERTFYRYLEVIFANDRRLLAENVSDDEFLN